MSNSFTGSNADKAREAYLFTFIEDLTLYLVQHRGPFKIPEDERRMSCMLAFDPDPSGARCPEIKPADTLDNYIRTNFLKVTSFEKLRHNWGVISGLIGQTVDSELTQLITIDPKLVIVGMREPGPANFSAYESLKLINAFLDDLSELIKTDPGSDYDPLLPELIKDTQNRITKVLNIVDMKPAEEWAEIKADDVDRIRLGRIYDIFALRLGVQFIPERVKKMVEWDLNRRLKRGDLPGKASAILVALGGELTERLSSRSENLDQVKLDLNQAQSLTQENMKTFMSLFGPMDLTADSPIEAAKKALLEAAEAAHEPVDSSGPRPNRDLLAELCTLTLIARPESAPRADFMMDVPLVVDDYCKGASYQSVYAKRFGSKASQLGLPLTFEYDHLLDIFSGKWAEQASGRARTAKWNATLSTQKAPWNWLASGVSQPVDMLSPELQAYDAIFKGTIYGSGGEEDLRFNRKVCTFHRFLRAGRIIEAMPALNPKYREMLKSK